MGGVEVSRAGAAFEAGGKSYPAGTFVIPMTQVFARYAKDMLEKQTYPEVRATPDSPPEPPYDVTAWSLGMLLGVETVFLKDPVPGAAALAAVGDDLKAPAGRVAGNGPRFVFPYDGPDTAIAINRLLEEGAEVAFERGADGTARVAATGVARARMEALAAELDLDVAAGPAARGAAAGARDPRAAHRHVPAVGGRQHGRRLDALGARAVRVLPDVAPQRRRQGGQARRPVRRDRPRRPVAARHRQRSDRRVGQAGVPRRDRRGRASRR